MQRILKIFSIILTILLLSGCVEGANTNFDNSETTSKMNVENNTNNDSGNNNKKETGDQSHINVSDNNDYTPEPFVLDDDLALGSLKVNMNKERIDEAIDAELSDSRKENTYGIPSEYLAYSDGTYIHLVEGKIYSIEVTSSDYPTPRGLKVGDSASEIEKLYGKPTEISEEGVWIYSPRGYDMFFVTVKDEVVQSIKVSLVM